MISALDRISGLANRVTELVLAPLLAFFAGLLVLSVFSRYVLQLPIVDVVEITRIAFVWACFLGAAAGVRRMAHVRVTVLVGLLPRATRPSGVLLAQTAFLVFGGMMVWHGAQLANRMTGTTFPTLQISQAWLYLALPVSGALIALHALAGLLVTLASWSAIAAASESA